MFSLKLAGAFVWGIALGLVFFGGLWATLRRISDIQRPRTVFWMSYGIRMVLCVAGLLIAARQGFVFFVLTCTGLYFTRLVLVRIIGRPAMNAPDKV